MFGSATVYAGLLITLAGLILAIRPNARLRVPSRRRALAAAGAGALITASGLLAPTFESRVTRASARIDEFAPAWQFREVHTIEIGASADRVYDAIKRVRADEIFLFRTLTWIRRAGKPLPPGILHPGTEGALIDVATRGGFVRLADDHPRELVIGAVVVAPPGTRGPITPATFREPLPPGFALATMNFLVTPDGPNASIVSTETRVWANSDAARRRFAPYWRAIYPGSAMIRRMWLRAIERRATR